MKLKYLFLPLLMLLWGCPITVDLPDCENSFVLQGFQLTANYTTFNTMGSSIEFKDEANGFLANGSSELHLTTDGGGTWTGVTPDAEYNLTEVCMAPSGNIFAIGFKQVNYFTAGIFRSQDNGNSWMQVYFPENDSMSISSIVFTDPVNGFAVGNFYNMDAQGNYSVIYSTHDGGENWETERRTEYIDHVCTAGTSIIAYSWLNYILRSDDNGTTWNTLNLASPNGINTVTFYNSEIGYYADYGSIFSTADGGATWTKIRSLPGNTNCIRVSPDNSIYVFGYGESTGFDINWSRGMIGFSEDGGANWIINSVFCEATSIKAVAFVGNDKFYVPGDYYEVIKFEK